MQETHNIDISNGVGVRFAGSIDRRLRPLNHQAAALKCPRCESLNTKFCYYNNYNLSQPRHFCKGCRRYWTKGGVLRNVPVGGGVRKTKRSSKSKPDQSVKESKSHNQSSSSESSSLTAATTAVEPPKSGTDAPVPIDSSKSEAPVAYTFPESRLYNLINPQSFDHQTTDGQIFPSDMGKFTNLMTPPEENMMSFGMRETKTMSFHVPAEENSEADEFKLGNEGLGAALDWGSGGDGGDQGMFDPAYWNHQAHEWSENDHSLNYLP